MKLGKALNSLRPGAEFVCGETYSSIIWFGEDKPTQEEVDAEIMRLDANAAVMEELRTLDREMPRALEDVINTGITVSTQAMEKKTRKEELRALLV